MSTAHTAVTYWQVKHILPTNSNNYQQNSIHYQQADDKLPRRRAYMHTLPTKELIGSDDGAG